EVEAKFIQDRIQSVERHIANFCQTFAQYSRKIARVRDKGDEIAKITLNYAESENINKSLALGLENFADCLSAIGDYGNMRTQSVDSKVVAEFARYEDICKHVRGEIKDIYSAREKEINKKRQLDRTRERNPRNRQQIIQAETDLVKATAEVSKTIHNLEEKTNTFERQKLHDIKFILLDFICIEVGYHAKALEVLTKAYNEIESINEESDLEEFKKSLRLPDTIHHQSPGHKRHLFKSTGSLGSLGAIFSSTHNKKTPGIPSSTQNFQQSKSEETLDSMKHSISDTSDASESENEDSSENNSSDEKYSPAITRLKKLEK
ncbi:hypothetical protein NQ317_010030, partial [Molorchus minor]